MSSSFALAQSSRDELEEGLLFEKLALQVGTQIEINDPMNGNTRAELRSLLWNKRDGYRVRVIVNDQVTEFPITCVNVAI
jgi:hypothetical protein